MPSSSPAPSARSPLAAAADAWSLARVRDLATAPVRLAGASVQVVYGLAALMAPEGPVRRPGGYAEQVGRIIGEGGLADRLAVVLADPEGPARLLRLVADVTSVDRPLGQALARDGAIDRLLAVDGPLERLARQDGAIDRLLAEGGPLDRVIAADGPLDRLLAPGGAVDRLTRPDGLIDRLLADAGAVERLLAPGGLLDRLLSEDGFADKLLADGGTLDQLVALGATLEEIHPRLSELAALIPSLHEAVDVLNTTVGPLGDLASRLPGGRRRTPVDA